MIRLLARLTDAACLPLLWALHHLPDLDPDTDMEDR